MEKIRESVVKFYKDESEEGYGSIEEPLEDMADEEFQNWITDRRRRKKRKKASETVAEDEGSEREELPLRKHKKKRRKEKRHSEELEEDGDENQMQEDVRKRKNRKRRSSGEAEDIEQGVDEVEPERKKKKKKWLNRRDPEESVAEEQKEEEEEESMQEIAHERKRKKKKKKDKKERWMNPENTEEPIAEEEEEEKLKEIDKGKRKKKKKKRHCETEIEPSAEQVFDSAIKKQKKKKKHKIEEDVSVCLPSLPSLTLVEEHFRPTAVNKVLREITTSQKIEQARSQEGSDEDDEVDDKPEETDKSIKCKKRQKYPKRSPFQQLLYVEGIFGAMDKIKTEIIKAEDVDFTGEDADPNFLMVQFFPLPRLDKVGDKFSYNVICWILRFDFPLPRLNRQKKGIFWYLSKKEIKEVLEKFPRFQSGRFTDAEDAVIVKRLQVLMKEVNLSSNDVKIMLKEMSSYSRANNRAYCRPILGAYLGRPMLDYRRAIDFFLRLQQLVKADSEVVDKDTAEKVIAFIDKSLADCPIVSTQRNSKMLAECREVTGIADKVSNKKVSSIYRENQISAKIVNTGRFTDEDISTIIYLVLKQAGTTKVTKIYKEKISWSKIEVEMRRKPWTVLRVWEEKIYPILSMHLTGENVDSLDWQVRLLELIIEDKTITERRQIQWLKFQEVFPCQTKYSMRKVLDNYVPGRLESKGDRSFRLAVERALERLRDKAMKETKPDKRVHMIITAYERVMKSLKKEFSERT